MPGNVSIGDLVLDPRKFLYLKSLKVLICVGLFECFDIASQVEKLLEAVELHKAESLILIGPIEDKQSLMAFSEHFLDKIPVHIVSSTKNEDIIQTAESLAMEWHQELVWAKYRFVESLDLGTVEMYFVSAIGGFVSEEKTQSFALKVGKTGFGGRKLPVFLKGLGQMILPSLNDESTASTVFSDQLSRYDLFAIGHTRVFPLGRVSELEPAQSFGKIPYSVIHKGSRKKNLKTKKKQSDTKPLNV